MFQDNKDLIKELSHIPIFSALNKTQLDDVVSSSTIVDLDSGDVLFNQGQLAEWFYLVRKGQIQLSLLSEVGSEKVLDIVHPGQLFAEAVMFMDKQCYPVNATAIQNSQLVAFDIVTFRNILKVSVDTCFRLMAIMSKHLHMQLSEIDRLSLHNATYRLVDYLLKSVPKNVTKQTEVTLNYPKNILASRLSIKPETFSRILGRLGQKKMIVVQGNQIILRDIKSLRHLLT
jgi:CRP-like cAMP-binding protein